MGIKRHDAVRQDGKINRTDADTDTLAASVLSLNTDKLEKDGANAALPTSDPGVAGELWADNLIVTVSNG